MSKQIGQFVLPDHVISSMKDKIKDTKKLKIELGFALCTEKNSNIITKGPECIGTKCSIKAETCKNNQTQVGDYHTHPRSDATMSITDMVTGCSEKMECIGSAKSNNVVCFSRKTEKSESLCLEDIDPFEDEEHKILEKGSEIREILNSPRSIIKTGIYNTLKELKQYDDRAFKHNVNRIRLLHKHFDRISI
jgi:proteasome lid subunit RPN8/RPN11